MAKNDLSKPQNDEDWQDVPHERSEPRPASISKPPPREKLPEALQRMMDDEEGLLERVYDGTAGETTDSNLRYAAYGSRIRTVLHSAHRYVAYTSDVAESFRPVAHPWLIKGGYAVSWLYLVGDVSHEGYKAYCRQQRMLNPALAADQGTKKTPNKTADPQTQQNLEMALTQIPKKVPPIDDYKTVMAQRAVFQSLASMGLPALTVHSIVRYSGRAMKNVKNPKIRTWGPVGLGLAAVPFLPYIFDKPVEDAVEWTFYKGFRAIGGPQAVGENPETGRQRKITDENREKRNPKEKEL